MVRPAIQSNGPVTNNKSGGCNRGSQCSDGVLFRAYSSGSCGSSKVNVVGVIRNMAARSMQQKSHLRKKVGSGQHFLPVHRANFDFLNLVLSVRTPHFRCIVRETVERLWSSSEIKKPADTMFIHRTVLQCTLVWS